MSKIKVFVLIACISSYFLKVGGEEKTITGTLMCGQETTAAYGGSQNYWILNTTGTDDFFMTTCGSYNTYYSNTKVTMYELTGSAGDTVLERDLEYVSASDNADYGYAYYGYYWHYYYYNDEPCCGPCYWLDSYVEVKKNAADLYVLNVSERSQDYSSYYNIYLECGTIEFMSGTLECGDSVEATYWESYFEHWFLDVSGAGEFSVSTCGSFDDYGTDTYFSLYGYEGDVVGSYSDTSYWSRIVSVNDDDGTGYCAGEGEYTTDSFYETKHVNYDYYVLAVEDKWEEGVGNEYNIKLVCDAEALTSLTTGAVVSIVVVPLILIMVGIWYVMNKKNKELVQQQELMHQQHMQQQQYQQQIVSGQMMQPMVMPPVIMTPQTASSAPAAMGEDDQKDQDEAAAPAAEGVNETAEPGDTQD